MKMRFTLSGPIHRWVWTGLLLCFMAACSPRMDLHSGLSESDANEMLSALISAGIPAEKKAGKEGATVIVPAARSAEAIAVLQAQGLPKGKQSGMGQVFKKDSMISSPLEERVRYLYALSQELEKTLATMDGVLTARVHIVLPERLVPGEPLVPSSAAVFIKHHPDINFAPFTPKIRSLVFNSIPGLTGDAYEKVSVMALPGLPLPTATAPLTQWGPLQFESRLEGAMTVAALGLVALWIASLMAVYLWMQRRLRAAGRAASTPSAPVASPEEVR